MASPTVVLRDAGPAPAVGSTGTQSLTLPPVTAGALAVPIGIMSAGAPVTVLSVAYDPTGANLPFTFFGRTQEAASQWGDVEIWYLLSPPAGTFNVVATFSTGVVYAMGFLFAQDVNQSTPWRATAQSTTGTGTTASTAVTTAAGDLSLDATMFDDFHNLTIGAGQGTGITTRNNCAGSFSFGASDETAVGATTTNSWTDGTSAPWIQVCGALQGTGGAATVGRLVGGNLCGGMLVGGLLSGM